MKVYISGTPEIKNQLINKVVNFLNQTKGLLTFESIERNEEFFENEKKSASQFGPISFQNLNNIAIEERAFFRIEQKDFYVILTSQILDIVTEYDKNWFSYFNHKNIFIRTYGWEEHTNGKEYLAISHQVIENIFQSLSGYIYERYDYYHQRAKGCINDFCENDYEIEFKLRTGHICKSCLDIAVSNGVNIEQIDQIKRQISYIRDQLLDFQTVFDEIEIPPMRITEKGKMYIGNTQVKLDPIHMTFYIFCVLKRNQVLSIDDFRENISKFRNIYFALKKTGSDKAVNTFMGLEVDGNGVILSKKDKGKMKKYIKDRRNKIKEKIVEAVGVELGDLYKIGSCEKLKYNHVKEFYSILPNNERLDITIEEGLHELMR